jgi:hypothetical protein
LQNHHWAELADELVLEHSMLLVEWISCIKKEKAQHTELMMQQSIHCRNSISLCVLIELPLCNFSTPWKSLRFSLTSWALNKQEPMWHSYFSLQSNELEPSLLLIQHDQYQ